MSQQPTPTLAPTLAPPNTSNISSTPVLTVIAAGLDASRHESREIVPGCIQNKNLQGKKNFKKMK
jgi:hypothetical protein